MGLTIHYSATLKNASVLDNLTREVMRIAVALEWRWTILSTPRMSGISVYPPNCEPVLLYFTPQGKSCGLAYLIPGAVPGINDSLVHVKTSAAGPEIHKDIIDLLFYLNKKYFREIQVCDEGKYWETRDYKILAAHFVEVTDDTDSLSRPTSGLLLSPGDDGFITQTLDIIRRSQESAN
jgi:hypothetical protein